MALSVQIKSLRPKHEAIIDLLLTDPTMSGAELSAKLGYTRGWLSSVMHSDVFKEMYLKRRSEHNSELSKQVLERQLGVTLKALTKVDKFLDDEEEVDLRSALEVADRTAKHLSFHAKPGLAPMLSETHTREVRERTVDQTTLREARETMTRVIHGLPADS